MNVNHSNIHNYLGMTIDYTTKGLYKIIIFDYIKEKLDTFDKIDPKATGNRSIEALTNLFFMRDGLTKL